MKVIVYKVTLPSLIAWPPGHIILNVSYTREAAEKYIESYPNALMRPFMKIVPDEADYVETD